MGNVRLFRRRPPRPRHTRQLATAKSRGATSPAARPVSLLQVEPSTSRQDSAAAPQIAAVRVELPVRQGWANCRNRGPLFEDRELGYLWSWGKLP
jgi:hypothetical protein